MWFQFIISFALEALFLFAPGYLAARALRLAHPLALGIAPAVSCGMLEVWTFIAWKAGIWANWAVVGLPVLVFALAAFAVGEIASRALGKGGMRIGGDCLPERRTLAVSLAAFAGAGLVICTLIFVKNLDGAASFFQAYDNLSHMMRIRSFVDTGVFSPMGVDLNYNLENPPLGDHDTGFYPSSWHCLAAIAASDLHVPVTLAINATNALFMALVAPISAWSLLAVALRGRTIAICAALPLAFASFPWGMITYGPLYPNMAAFAMVLGAAACYMAIFQSRASAPVRALCAAAFLACLAGLGLSHPNAVFTLAIILVPYTCARVLDLPCFIREDGGRGKLRFAACAGLFALAVGIWALALNSPFMSSVVNFTWPSFANAGQAALRLVTLALRDAPAQYLLALLVAMGTASALRQRTNRWMIASLAIAAAMYLVNVSSEGPLKMWLTGFWYQDSYRICGVLSLVALPLACLGLLAITDAVKALLASPRKPAHTPGRARHGDRTRTLNVPAVLTGLIAAMIAVVLFHPAYYLPGNRMIDTAFGYTRYLISFENNASRSDDVLGAEERAFLDKAAGMMEPGAVILNHPYDGSAMAAPVLDLNVYWRFWGGYHQSIDNEASRTLRFGADRMAEDEHVKAALRESGAQYLLMLDQGTLAKERYMRHTVSYHPEDWTGLEAIDDQTPGLELLLGEGDMRLYRITATEGE